MDTEECGLQVSIFRENYNIIRVVFVDVGKSWMQRKETGICGNAAGTKKDWDWGHSLSHRLFFASMQTAVAAGSDQIRTLGLCWLLLKKMHFKCLSFWTVGSMVCEETLFALSWQSFYFSSISPNTYSHTSSFIYFLGLIFANHTNILMNGTYLWWEM